ncbi:hypothetical protein [Enemella sp. A6]|uniref:hypothetical protein n=1 Tax=Enemella sp. A6 TaxID=3440152 RepID=UPI003EB71E38
MSIAGAITAAVVVGIGVLSGLALMPEIRRQRREWAKWAQARGWHHLAESRGVFGGLRAQPFGRGLAHASNIISGTWDGLPFTMYHYTRHTGVGKSSRTITATVAQFAGDADFPTLVVYRGELLNGSRDINFESAEFNRTYDVRCADERFAYQVVHPRFMHALMNSPLRDANFTLERGVVTVWMKDHVMRERGTQPPQALAELVRLIPRHVWADHGGTPPELNDDGPTPAVVPPLPKV